MRLIEQFKSIFKFSDEEMVAMRSNIDSHRAARSQFDQITEMESRGELYYDSAPAQFSPTHQHVKTGGYYRVTRVGRLEVTGDEAYPLVEYENEAGERFAQRADRFFDGRFQEVLL